MQAWALLTKVDDRSWESNDGYPDVLGSTYVYDSAVANHLRVALGDLVVLRDSRAVHGVSRIDRIDSRPALKDRYVCPKCRRGGQVQRTTKRKGPARYLCRHKDCRNQFDEALHFEQAVTRYTASYGSQWQALDGALAFSEIRPLLDGSQQGAIRRCDPDGLVLLLQGLSVPVPKAPIPRSRPPRGGRREALVRVRNGQREFREGLLNRYGWQCAITGPCPSAVLQAAHLRGYAKFEAHDLDEGLLLRSDVHQLFDAGLMAVDPKTREVMLAPSLDAYPDYQKLKGVVIADGPYMLALADHFDEATGDW